MPNESGIWACLPRVGLVSLFIFYCLETFKTSCLIRFREAQLSAVFNILSTVSALIIMISPLSIFAT